MIDHLRIRNFKSWQDTGDVRLGKLTGVFGTNSSGKTSLLQALLLLKQTVESPDRHQVLNTGAGDFVDAGTYADFIYDHQTDYDLQIELGWQPTQPFQLASSENPDEILVDADHLHFATRIGAIGQLVRVKRFTYEVGGYTFGMELQAEPKEREVEYALIAQHYAAKRTLGRKWPLPAPVKSYGFPNEAVAYYQNTGFLPDLSLAFEELFDRVHYLGPLRVVPERYYLWSGERPQDVGVSGGSAMAALLASRERDLRIHRGKGRKTRTIEEHVAVWLRDLGLISSFRLEPVSPGQKAYEIKVKVAPTAPEVYLHEVGFGVSQVLPVLVLCFYAEPGSTLLFEQPEIHLHPRVQADLADVFIEAIKLRGVQIIVESHSEHLLRRLQRRIAEEQIEANDVALYFAERPQKVSRLRPLDVDAFGNIRNWPPDFFGDEMGDLAAMTEAAMKRRLSEAGDGA